MDKISLNSDMYKRVEKNLKLENFTINEKVELRAIDAVNSGKNITPAMIKEVIKLGQK
ncbi:hypothetical protein [Domibacillus enclensis]|uniref:hypothetical protein n=1 Tax=Domibacillus enclensis TaxID=1017273 RepID=UPI0012DFE986|nr:hypothetical protein [Domibacillus enclensis]